MKFWPIIFVFVMVCIAATSNANLGIYNRSQQESADNSLLAADSLQTFASQPADSSCHLSIVVAGDLMQHEAQIKAALQKDGSYDYSGYFDHVAEELTQADVAIANLEVTMGGKPYRGYPCFSAPDEYLSVIKNAGFDLLLTANNHSCDRRKKGILRTIEMCDSLQIPHVGTYVDSLARNVQYPFLLEKNGFRIAILEFTYGTNGIPIPAPTIVNRMDTAQMSIDIEKAKSLHPDLIIAFPHWGIEYETLPRKSMVKMAQWLIDKGVDHVIGGHPHVVQPIELREDSLTNEQHLVAYSLGNFISDQSSLPKYGGMMLRFELEKAGPLQKARIAKCDYMLTFVSRPAWSRKKNYCVYPVSVSDTLLNNIECKLRDKYVQLARDLFEKHNIGVKEYVKE